VEEFFIYISVFIFCFFSITKPCVIFFSIFSFFFQLLWWENALSNPFVIAYTCRVRSKGSKYYLILHLGKVFTSLCFLVFMFSRSDVSISSLCMFDFVLSLRCN